MLHSHRLFCRTQNSACRGGPDYVVKASGRCAAQLSHCIEYSLHQKTISLKTNTFMKTNYEIRYAAHPEDAKNMLLLYL